MNYVYIVSIAYYFYYAVDFVSRIASRSLVRDQNGNPPMPRYAGEFIAQSWRW